MHQQEFAYFDEYPQEDPFVTAADDVQWRNETSTTLETSIKNYLQVHEPAELLTLVTSLIKVN
jgi:hypothetical protein